MRFLPVYDNVVLGYADRTRMTSDETRRTLAGSNVVGNVGSVLVDGVVRALWKITREHHIAVLTIQPLARLNKKDTTAVCAEGDRLLAFMAFDADQRDVRLEPLSRT